VPRILVVDDDPLVCNTIEACLRRQGFEVTVADGGAQGIQALENATFDVMLVDIFMPHMRGFESIRTFHERAPTVPLIAMSGYAFASVDTSSPDFLKMTLELGAAVCLRKPFTPTALLAAVNECLGKAAANAAPNSRP
jgi:CheY-like chemotaxis protein